MTTFASDAEFWQSSPKLTYVLRYCRAVQAPPFAVLAAVLARVATVVPPNIVAPAFVGASPAPLNLFVAVVGESGDGKGLAETTAAAMLPDMLGAETVLPASGEGLVTLFAGRRAVEGVDGPTKRTELVAVNQRALLSVPEIGNLGAAMGRQGSTLSSVLLSAWSGERLGGHKVDADKNLRATPFGYKLNLITGVQPARSDVLFSRDGEGLPQRFLWVDTTDRDAPPPTELPEKPDGTLDLDTGEFKKVQPSPELLTRLYQAGGVGMLPKLENGSTQYPLTILTYPRAAWEAVRLDGYNRLTKQRPDGMDAHALLVRIKLAGLFAMLEQREDTPWTVTADDWERARYMMLKSTQTREACEATASGRRISQRERQLAEDGAAKDRADRQLHAERVADCKTRLPELVRKLSLQAPDGVPEGRLRAGIAGANKDGVAEALSELVAEGVLASTTGERGGTRYSLAR